jgi:hypothetical protein
LFGEVSSDLAELAPGPGSVRRLTSLSRSRLGGERAATPTWKLTNAEVEELRDEEDVA